MPEPRPSISVVIPVWNGERFVKEAVDSVVAQGYPSLEIVIVDDGSTDGTASVVRALSAPVRYLHQDNAGPAAARNHGIRASAGELLAFLDADDLWPADHLEVLAGELERDPGLDVARGHAQILKLDPATGAYVPKGDPRESFPFFIGAGLYRRRVFDTVGLFDQTMKFGEDNDWYTRAAERQVPIRRLDRVMLMVRRHDVNMTQDRDQIRLSNLQVFKKALDRKRSGGAPEGPSS